jgi:hypothetical protein
MNCYASMLSIVPARPRTERPGVVVGKALRATAAWWRSGATAWLGGSPGTLELVL